MIFKFAYNKIRGTIGFIVGYCKNFYIKSLVKSKSESEFAEYLREIRKYYNYKDIDGRSVLLIPLINDVGTMKVIIKLGYKLALEKELNIRFFYVYTAIDTKIDRSNIFLFHLQQFQNYNIFWINKLCRTYGIKRSHIIISNYIYPKYRLSSHLKFKNKREVLEFKFRGIRIGELIYDTYLRFRSQHTLNLEDPCLNDIVEYFMNMTDMWIREIETHSIKSLLLPYTSYSNWGTPSYTCLNKNIEVLTFGSVSYVLSILSTVHPYHSKNFHLYKERFKTVEHPARKKQLAGEVLNKRLVGDIDVGTYYMKKSAFDSNVTHEFSSGSQSWCVIFLHCFFDSPHIYGESLFPDFYEWTIHILMKAKELPHQDYYFKEHPNALLENKKIVAEIKERFSQYSNIIFLSADITNRQIIDQRPSAIFTVYGTVAHEFASLGIPVIVAGKNPQSDYGFIHKPESIKEFDHYIRNFSTIGLPESYDKEEIYEFFYMHYLFYSEKFDVTNFSKQLDLNNGVINIPKEIPYQDFIY